MLSPHKQAVKVFRRVRDFLTAGAPTVGYGSVAKVVEQLTGVVNRLETYAREQEARRRQALAATRVKRARAATVVTEYLRPVVRGAKALFPEDPALLAAFRVPRVRDYQGTLAAAEAMAQTASAHRARFVEVGLPEDFIERLQQAAVDLRAAIDGHAQEFGKRSASTAGLRKEYTRGRDLVRMLDAMVAPRLAGTPDRLAEWRTISRFERRPVSPAEPVESPVGDGDEPVEPTVQGDEPVLPGSEDEVRAA